MGRHQASHYRIILLVALLYATPLFAQFDFPPSGGRSAAMGGASVVLDDGMSAMGNIVALGEMDRAMLALSARQSVGVDGMGYATIGGVKPVGFGALAALLDYFGNSDYNEERLSLAYAIPMGHAVSFGVAFHYLHSGTSDPYYDPLNRLTFSTALRYSPSKTLVVGFKAFNPVAIESDGNGSPRIPAVFNFGVSYWLLDDLLAVGEVEKNLYQRATLRFGLEYSVQEMYFFRVGINTQPAIYTFGIGAKFKDFGVDLAAQFHSALGLTPQLSLQYMF